MTKSTYAVILGVFGIDPVAHVIIALDDDPDEALRLARQRRAEIKDRYRTYIHINGIRTPLKAVTDSSLIYVNEQKLPDVTFVPLSDANNKKGTDMKDLTIYIMLYFDRHVDVYAEAHLSKKSAEDAAMDLMREHNIRTGNNMKIKKTEYSTVSELIETYNFEGFDGQPSVSIYRTIAKKAEKEVKE